MKNVLIAMIQNIFRELHSNGSAKLNALGTERNGRKKELNGGIRNLLLNINMSCYKK